VKIKEIKKNGFLCQVAYFFEDDDDIPDCVYSSELYLRFIKKFIPVTIIFLIAIVIMPILWAIRVLFGYEACFGEETSCQEHFFQKIDRWPTIRGVRILPGVIIIVSIWLFFLTAPFIEGVVEWITADAVDPAIALGTLYWLSLAFWVITCVIAVVMVVREMLDIIKTQIIPRLRDTHWFRAVENISKQRSEKSFPPSNSSTEQYTPRHTLMGFYCAFLIHSLRYSTYELQLH
jgi:hypothetical protein